MTTPRSSAPDASRSSHAQDNESLQDTPQSHITPGRIPVAVGPAALLVSPYRIVVSLVLVAVAFVLFLTSISFGDFPLSLSEVLSVFLGGGDRLERTIVLEWRLDRALIGLFVGMAFGLAGALFQSVARNPLASPDILGISMGASAAAVTIIILGSVGGGVLATLRSSTTALSLAAFAGSFAAAALIALLSLKRGMDAYRMVLIGLGVNALLTSVVTFMMVTSPDPLVAADALVWLTGSLHGRSSPQVVAVGSAIVIATVLLVLASKDLIPLRIGDDGAHGLGVPVKRRQMLYLAIGVGLTALAVAAAGPISFIAFISPQLARMLLRMPSPPLIGSALTGAVLILASDLIARTIFAWPLPVGVVTAAIGGPFLLVILVRLNRKVTL